MSSERANREAVDWLLRLESAAPGMQQAFQQWLQASAEHAQAWQRVNSLFAAPLADLAAVEQRSSGQLQLARQTLARPLTRRHVLGGGLATLLLGAGSAVLGNRATPLAQVLADVHTATGAQTRRTLPEGSRLALAARSAADLSFDGPQRRITLREGALYLQQADASVPLQLTTSHGTLYSNANQLALRQLPDASLLSVLAGRVRVQADNGQVSWVRAGQVLRFGPAGSAFEAPSLWSRAGWLSGRMEVRDEPLGEVIDALRPWHAGWLRVSTAAARLPVYGSFALDDLPRTLQALAETLPIQLQQAGPWFSAIDLKKV